MITRRDAMRSIGGFMAAMLPVGSVAKALPTTNNQPVVEVVTDVDYWFRSAKRMAHEGEIVRMLPGGTGFEIAVPGVGAAMFQPSADGLNAFLFVERQVSDAAMRSTMAAMFCAIGDAA